MNVDPVSISQQSFPTFGDLLKYLRRRARLTQLELSIAVGYSEAQISRLEKNQRLPDLTAVQALFIPALHLEDEPQIAARLLELAQSARQEDSPAPGIAPYKGLLFFDESDCELFFGREALTAQLASHVMDLARDASTRFLAVVGASGSGKSSLVRAGLAVTFKRAGWDTRIFTPTASPLKTLQSNLHAEQIKAAERTLFLVDQFEEVFTLCHDEMERITFIEKLLACAQEESKKITVVVALRADFYSHCAQYPMLRSAIAARQEYIGQMTAEEMLRAIEEPARRGGWEFEPGLVDILLQDVGAYGSHGPEPGALPLLSHALLATWERRRGCIFTLRDYHATGGVRGAITETAESVFADQLNQTQQEIARDIFLRLTELGEGTEDTRRRASLKELVRNPEEAVPLRAVLNILVDARLIILNEDSAEVAHEALIREWHRLHEWLTKDRESLLLHRHLTESAHEWEIRGYDSSELYRGARLARAREWVASNEGRLNRSEQAFLVASIEQEQHAVLERETQRQRELEAAQRLAATEQRRAEEQTRSANQMRQRAHYLTLALMIALIMTCSTLSFSNQSDANAQDALNARATAESYADNTAILLNVVVGKNLIPNRGRTISASLSAYSPDGKLTAERSEDINITVLDSAGNQLFKLAGHTNQITDISFSPDGTRLASSSLDGTAILWDVANGKALYVLRGHTGPIESLDFRWDGKRLVTASDDRTANIWDTATGDPLLSLPEEGSGINDAVFSRDGTRIATANKNGTVQIWDETTGKEILSVKLRSGSAISVAFSPDGKWLAAVNSYDSANIWNADTGDVLYEFVRPNFNSISTFDQVPTAIQ